mgnify:CR=1 FL=1
MKKRDLIVYRIITGLFSAFLLAGAITYFADYKMVSDMFISLRVPTEIIYPLAIVKILGIAAIWLIKNKTIIQLAYLGFGLDLVFAIMAHLNVADGRAFAPVVPLALLSVSYFYFRKLYK